MWWTILYSMYTMLINNLFTSSFSTRATRTAYVAFGVYKTFFFHIHYVCKLILFDERFFSAWSSTVNFTQNVLSVRLHVRKIYKNDCINTLMLIYVTIKAASKLFAENMSTINGLVDYQYNSPFCSLYSIIELYKFITRPYLHF